MGGTSTVHEPIARRAGPLHRYYPTSLCHCRRGAVRYYPLSRCPISTKPTCSVVHMAEILAQLSNYKSAKTSWRPPARRVLHRSDGAGRPKPSSTSRPSTQHAGLPSHGRIARSPWKKTRRASRDPPPFPALQPGGNETPPTDTLKLLCANAHGKIEHAKRASISQLVHRRGGSG